MAIAAGRYYIINLGNIGSSSTLPLSAALALEVQKNQVTNGANIRLYTLNYSNSQSWDVSYRSDGTARIMQHYSGKAVDNQRDQLIQGNNIRIYQNNESAAQSWTIAEQSSSVTFNGTSYTKCKIQVARSTGWEIEANGSPSSVAAGTNIDIAAATSENDHYFIFVPVPTFENDGVYEIHCAIDPRMVVEVARASTADGARIQIYNSNGGNNQKFAFEEVSSGVYAIRNIGSGKYIHIFEATAKASQPLVQWAGKNATQAQWQPVVHPDTTYNGVRCAVLGFNSNLNPQFSMDVKGGVSTPSATVQIFANTNGANQDFILYPTAAEDPNMPVPYSLGLAREYQTPASENDLRSSTIRECKTALYLTWFCSDAWITDGANHYQVRYRVRDMSPTTSTYNAWTSWTAWQNAPCIIRGKQAYLTTPMAGMYQFTTSKHRQIEFQVRTVGAGDDMNVHSKAADQIVDIVKPNVADLTAAAFSMDGLHFDYESNYVYGANKIHFNSVKVDGVECLKERYTATGMDSDTSVLLPIDYLKFFPSEGSTVVVKYQNGTDQSSQFAAVYTKTLTVEYDSSHGATATPTLTYQSASRTILAAVNHVGEERLWITYDGGAYEVTGLQSGNKTYFTIPYPFRKDFDLWVEVSTTNRDSWGTWNESYTPESALIAESTPCHAWTWDGGGCVLEVRQTGDAETQRQRTAITTAYALDSRKHQTVAMATTSQDSFTATGLLLEGITETEIVDIMEDLYEQQHVFYRSPHGDLADVAITGVQQSTTRNRTVLTVTMVQE